MEANMINQGAQTLLKRGTMIKVENVSCKQILIIKLNHFRIQSLFW
jgi:hypothetical protein